MRKFFSAMIIALAIAGMTSGCKKGEQQPVKSAVPQIPAAPLQSPTGLQSPMGQQLPEQMPGQGMMSPHGGNGAMAPKAEKTVVIPDFVKGKWSKVVLAVDDKSSNKKEEYKVKLKSDFNIPNSNLKIAVGDFIPDFKMSDSTITSGSNNPDNSAVKVEIFEGGTSLFKGWLFSKFPTMHPFQHPRYAVTLKEGIKS